MEKKNWIEKTKKAIKVAMNNRRYISAYCDKDTNSIGFCIETKDRNRDVSISFFSQTITIMTQNGYICVDCNLTDRDKLELQTLVLSVKEYEEDMAILEFEEFISSDIKEEITDINNLDD